jgi:hypothetical protein
MYNKTKNQTVRNSQENHQSNAFFKSEVMDLRSIKAALSNLYNHEPEPLFFGGQFYYI